MSKISLVLSIVIALSLNFKAQNDTIKIASWNIQMIPKIYAPFTKLARKKQKVRTPKIIQYLNSTDFDIIVLQEVFDKSISKKFKADLKINYPYCLMPQKEGLTLKLSSGVMILSKYPFELVKHVVFNVSKKSDRGAQKGCSLVKINVNDKDIFLAGTHLDSKSNNSRTLQYQITNDEILKPYINDSIPLIIAGDFNTDFKSSQYDSMMTSFELKNFELNDDRPFTFDEFNTWNAKGYKAWIDFIFFQENKNIKVFNQYILRPVMKFKNSKMDLADHYQIVIEAVIY